VSREEFHSSRLNVLALAEVLTGDDSASIRDLDVWVEARSMWVDMGEAFTNRDIITDNYNTRFGEPVTQADRDRGYFE